MVQQLSIDNALNYLSIAITYDLDRLQHSCEKIIGENTSAVLKQPVFLNCSQNILSAILKLNKISCSEANVFDGCMKWAKQRCSAKELEESGENIRNELGNCFSLIRFKEMGNAEVGERLKIYKGGLFSADLLSELSVYFGEANVIVDTRHQMPVVVYSFDRKGATKIAYSPTGVCTCVLQFSTSTPMFLSGIQSSNIWLCPDTFLPLSFTQAIQITKDTKIIYSSNADYNTFS